MAMAMYNQDAIMENIMLFSPMPVLQAIQDSFTESMLADEYLDCEDLFTESVPVHKSGKSRKQRRAVRIDCNKRKKGSDRAHGKHARNIRKAIWEDTADWDDMSNNTYYRWDDKRKTFSSPKMPKVHRVKRTFRDRMDCATRDRLNDVSEIDRLTASVLAEVKQYHGMVGWTDNVFYLSGAICRREQLPYPDYAYVREVGEKVELVLEYFDSYDDEDYSTHERIVLR